MLTALALALGAACAVPPSLRPQESSEGAAGVATTSRVRQAALFKNGLAFVRRTAEVPAGASELRLVDLPAPVHGTFWLTGDPAQLSLGPAVARPDVRVELEPARSVAQVLRANQGRVLSLLLIDGTTLTGTITQMPESEPQPVPRSAYPSQPWMDLSVRPPGDSAGILYLQGPQGLTVLSSGEVKRVRAVEGELAREFERRTAGVSLTVSAQARGAQTAELGLQYLTRGLTWAPSYAIDVSDPATARLSAKAVLINESEDLLQASCELVTGFPNLQFGHVIDPLALRGDLDSFLNALMQGPAAGGASVMAQSVMSNVAMGRAAGPAFPSYGAPSEGAAVEDLFFYEVPDVTLARGERGLYPLFTLEVPYEHIYQWSVPDTIDESVDRRASEQPPDEEIWHSLRLENNSKLPWTTAPAMTQKGGRLLGQDTLSYTAVGASTTVRITRAVDVQGEKAEFESARERASTTVYGNRYDLVTIEGRLRATNHKREAVTLEIDKRLQGEVTANPDEARVETVAEGLRRVNPNQHLIWSVHLEAGATVEVRYTYRIYVRS